VFARPGLSESEYFSLLTEHPRRSFLIALNTLLIVAALVLALFSLGAEKPVSAAASATGGAGTSLVSPKKVKLPRAKPGFRLSDRHVTVGEAIRFSARVKAKGRRAFKIVVRGPKGGVIRGRTSHAGRYRHHWRPQAPGVYRLRAFTGKNRHARGSRGTRRTVTVYRPTYASWFGPGFYGGRTACGQILTSGMLGVAHKTLPCGTKVRLRYRGRSVTVRVIDRGPYIAGREYDLTYATKQKLGFGDLGTVYSSR
jgi:rare lipoprotein A